MTTKVNKMEHGINFLDFKLNINKYDLNILLRIFDEIPSDDKIDIIKLDIINLLVKKHRFYLKNDDTIDIGYYKFYPDGLIVKGYENYTSIPFIYALNKIKDELNYFFIYCDNNSDDFIRYNNIKINKHNGYYNINGADYIYMEDKCNHIKPTSHKTIQNIPSYTYVDNSSFLSVGYLCKQNGEMYIFSEIIENKNFFRGRTFENRIIYFKDFNIIEKVLVILSYKVSIFRVDGIHREYLIKKKNRNIHFNCNKYYNINCDNMEDNIYYPLIEFIPDELLKNLLK